MVFPTPIGPPIKYNVFIAASSYRVIVYDRIIHFYAAAVVLNGDKASFFGKSHRADCLFHYNKGKESKMFPPF